VTASVLDAIGGTPLLRLKLPGVPPGVELLAKCEWFNPGGSVKDRTALSIVAEGERTGALVRGKVIVDSSSGNTAVGLALVGRAKGYAVELVMPSSVADPRRRLCEAYGAALRFTDPMLGSDGALLEVRARVTADPARYFYADQYRNPANPLAHYRTTGPEIWDQTRGRVTHFVAGLGTCGTVVGTGRYLHERRRDIHVVAVEPDHGMHGMEGLKHLESSIVPEVYDRNAHDEKVTVSTEDAYRACAEVLASDGLLVGHSAGAALVAARALAARAGHGVIVALLPDGGERYLDLVGGPSDPRSALRRASQAA
jgi:S-sulfo-L-cysteine synthase (O-acetyl-L-serine-dependent)